MGIDGEPGKMVRLREIIKPCGFVFAAIWFASEAVLSAGAAEPIPIGHTEVVAKITAAMPAGIALDNESRIYLSFPNWGDRVPPFALARLEDGGRLTAFPSASGARYDETKPNDLVSVLGIRMDQAGLLWVLDNARPRFKPAPPGAIKLLAFDSRTGREAHRHVFPDSVASLNRSFLNDLVIDEAADAIYISDMSTDGRGAIVVYDRSRREAWRVLDGHQALAAEPTAIFIERRQVPLNGGIDGIALSPDGSYLYWKALAGRSLYRIRTEFLRNRQLADSARSAAVEKLGDAPITDGMLTDADGNVYFTSLEQSAVIMRRPNGDYDILSSDRNIVWPDSMAFDRNGWLYLVSNQINRMPLFNAGKDMRRPPYYVLRIRRGQP